MYKMNFSLVISIFLKKDSDTWTPTEFTVNLSRYRVERTDYKQS